MPFPVVIVAAFLPWIHPPDEVAEFCRHVRDDLQMTLVLVEAIRDDTYTSAIHLSRDRPSHHILVQGNDLVNYGLRKALAAYPQAEWFATADPTIRLASGPHTEELIRSEGAVVARGWTVATERRTGRFVDEDDDLFWVFHRSFLETTGGLPPTYAFLRKAICGGHPLPWMVATTPEERTRLRAWTEKALSVSRGILPSLSIALEFTRTSITA